MVGAVAIGNLTPVYLGVKVRLYWLGAVKVQATVTCEFVAKTPPELAIQPFTAGLAESIRAWRFVPFRVIVGVDSVPGTVTLPVSPSKRILFAPLPSCSVLAFQVIC